MQNIDIFQEVNLFQTLSIPNEFGGNIDFDDFDVVEDWCEIQRGHFNKKFSYYHGVSKVCFLFEEYDWVAKIPFNGYECCVYEDDEENFYWEEFNVNGVYDFCNEELLNYEHAMELGIERFFAETRYFCSTKSNHPIYIQEKITPVANDKEERTPSEVSLSKIDNKYNRTGCDKTWLASALDFYGEELFERFLDFINEKHPEIGRDLHYRNVGYRKDGSPCILDFSGFGSI